MINLNNDGFAAPYPSHQFNPGSAALHAWQQAAQQLALQQLLAQQFATQNMQPTFATGPMRTAGSAPNPSSGLPISAPLTWAVQQIAQSLYALSQQLTQLAAQSSIGGSFGNAYANQAFPNPAYGNPYAPTTLGQQMASGFALH